MNIEREIKLRLAQAPAAELFALAPHRRSVASIYYDTPRQELRRAGIALRLRRDAGRWVQTLKVEGTPHAGLASRAEWELPVSGRSLQPGAFPGEEIRRRTGVDLARLAARLRPVFETRVMRRSGILTLKKNATAELSIDRGRIIAGRRREPISEVELELVSGDSGTLLRFAQGLRLPLAYESKAERGYRLSAGLGRAPRKWRMPSLDPAAPAGAAFVALFSEALAQASVNAASMPASADAEYLHQLRVALRRLRAALRAFAPVVEGAKPLRKALARLLPALGDARDRDVLVQTLEDAGAPAPLLRKARRERARARRAALAVVTSAQFRGFFFDALRWLESRPPAPAVRLLQLAPARMERLHAQVLADPHPTTAKRRHKLRIRIKRLRYACEFFAPCFAPGAVKRYLARLTRVQDLLGELNDITVAGRLLAQFGAAPPGRLETRERRLARSLEGELQRFRSEPPCWRQAG